MSFPTVFGKNLEFLVTTIYSAKTTNFQTLYSVFLDYYICSVLTPLPDRFSLINSSIGSSPVSNLSEYALIEFNLVICLEHIHNVYVCVSVSMIHLLLSAKNAMSSCLACFDDYYIIRTRSCTSRTAVGNKLLPGGNLIVAPGQPAGQLTTSCCSPRAASPSIDGRR